MNYSILIVSCDKNIKLLDVFFAFFKRFYMLPENTPVYLSMEESTYQYDGLNIHVINDTCGNWSLRVKNALNHITEDATLLLLDDFIIESPVLINEIERLSKAIHENTDIAHFALTTVPMRNESDVVYYGKYFKRHRFGNYKTTLQAGLWRTEILKRLLNDGESAWQFEIYANIRSYVLNKSFYAVTSKELKPIAYNEGLFCVQGKQNEEEVVRLSNKFGIDLHIDGFPNNGGVVVRDPCPLPRKIFRRLKITAYQMLYYLKYLGLRHGKK